MDPLSFKDGARASTGAEAVRARIIAEIGPRDLPEPPGGWVDLVLDGEGDAGPPPALAAAGRLAPPPAAPAPAGAGAWAADRAPVPRIVASWILVPEALVVAAFLAVGMALTGAVHLLRRPVPAEPRSAAAIAPAEAGPVIAPLVRRAAVRSAQPAARTAPEAPPAGAEALAVEAPIDPQSPPAPDLAPWSGGD